MSNTFILIPNSDVNIDNNIITKIDGGLWTGYVSSEQSYTGNAYIKFKTLHPNNNNLHSSVGLGPNSSISSPNEIDYGLYFEQGTLRVLHNYTTDVTGANSGTYVKDDIFEIIYTGTKVQYYQNGYLFYTSIDVQSNKEFYFKDENVIEDFVLITYLLKEY